MKEDGGSMRLVDVEEDGDHMWMMGHDGGPMGCWQWRAFWEEPVPSDSIHAVTSRG